MIDYQRFYQRLQGTPLQAWGDELLRLADAALHDRRHGKMPEWLSWLEELPMLEPASIDLGGQAVRIGSMEDIDAQQRQQLEQVLRRFHPWRKGPFSVFGIEIDTEWRSDWKWQRIQQHLTPLSDRLVLDVGCGSGYHLFRMLADGARLAVGVDPTMLYVMQFHALMHFMPAVDAFMLPLRGDELPQDMSAFDTVFSMGVLYHCRSPFDHLRELKGQLRPGGELVLETLIVEGDAQTVLVPQDRYAKMRNVWFIPSSLAMESWLLRSGFTNVQLVDETPTMTDEQRSTSWMTFESLADFLDADDQSLTVEGYPAPRRAVFIAAAP